MLAPKRIKHRKQHRGNMRGKAKGHTEIQYGDYGIVAMEPGWITNRQIEAEPCRDDPAHQAWRQGVDQRSSPTSR